MNPLNAAYAAYQFTESAEPRYVFRVQFSDSAADDMYVRSHGDIDLTGVAGSVLTNARLGTIAVISQTLDIQNGVSRIGKMNFSGVDIDRELTDHQRTQFNANHTARYRDVAFYKGFRELAWPEYELQATQILQGTTYRAGSYNFKCRDIQRAARKDVFEPIELKLAQPLDEDGTTVEIVSRLDAKGRQLAGFLHDTGFTDRPGEKVAYVKIDDEIISVAHDDILPNQLVNVTRGALGTRPEAHTSGEAGKKVEEYVYLEGAFPRVAYGILTGFWLGQAITEPMPDHWSAGIPGQYIKTSDFLEIGDDWITTDPSQGMPVEIKGPGKTDAKRYIERQIMRIFSAFMPVYNDGSLGMKRNQPTLSTAAPVGTITDAHLKQGFTPTVTYAYDKIVNDLEIKYSEVDGELRRTVPLVDQESQDAHQPTPKVTFEAAALSGSRYSPVALAEIIKRFRDRYAYAPIETSVQVAANSVSYEIGDVVRLQTRALVLFTNEAVNGGILHSFEVQGVTHNVRSGTITYKLFGTSREAGDIAPDFTNFAIPDALYENNGQFIRTISGVVDNGTAYELPDGLNLDGEYWSDKDVTIASGRTVTYNDQTKLWIRGVLSCFGKLDGKGRGIPGSGSLVDVSAIPQFGNNQRIAPSPPATTAGTPGFLGTTQADGSLIERTDRQSGGKYHYWGQSVISTITQGQYNEMPSFYVRMEDGGLVGVPADLRGTSGGGGGYRAFREKDNGTVQDTMGGAGGAGGASLVVICRGWTFGAGGELDSSGEDGSPGTINFSHELPAYSGTGAGGAPGGTLCVIDGSLSPIPQKFGHVTADYGDSSNPVGANKLTEAFISAGDTKFGPESDEEAQQRTNRYTFFESGVQGVALGGGAFRSVFAVPDLPIEGDGTDEELLKQQVIGLTVTEAYDEREDPKVTLIKATVTRTSVSNVYSASAIYQRLKGTQNWLRMGYAEDSIDFDLPADGQEYEIQARPVLINGEESLDGAVVQSFVTDSNQASAAPDDITLAALVEAVALKIRVPRTAGKPDYVNVYRSTTINDAAPGFVKREPVFFVSAPVDGWCTTDLVDSTVTGGTQYFYWATSVNEQGESALYPTGNGIGITPQDNAGGAPGTPGQDAISGETKRLEIHVSPAGDLDKTSPQTLRLEFTRGGGVVSSHDVTVTFDKDGIRTATGIHVSGEATGLAVPVSGLNTKQAKYTARHAGTDKKAYLDIVIIGDGATGVDAQPPGVDVGGRLSMTVVPNNQTPVGTTNAGEFVLTAGTFVRPSGATITLAADATMLTPLDSVGYQAPSGRLFLFSGPGSDASARFTTLTLTSPARLVGLYVGGRREDGQFFAVDNNGTEEDFTPLPGFDYLLATLYQGIGDISSVAYHISDVVDGLDGVNGKDVEFQFSVDGVSNWHDTPNPGVDKFIRFRTEGGAWGPAQLYVGEDGSSINFIFQDSPDKPARPTGNVPAGWQDDTTGGDTNSIWWISEGSFIDGALVGQWSDPIRLTGTDGRLLFNSTSESGALFAEGDFTGNSGPAQIIHSAEASGSVAATTTVPNVAAINLKVNGATQKTFTVPVTQTLITIVNPNDTIIWGWQSSGIVIDGIDLLGTKTYRLDGGYTVGVNDRSYSFQITQQNAV